MRADFDLLNRGRRRPAGSIALGGSVRRIRNPMTVKPERVPARAGRPVWLKTLERQNPTRAAARRRRNSPRRVTTFAGETPEAGAPGARDPKAERQEGTRPSRDARRPVKEKALKGKTPRTDPDETLRGGSRRRRRRHEGHETLQAPVPRHGCRGDAARTGTVEGAETRREAVARDVLATPAREQSLKGKQP